MTDSFEPLPARPASTVMLIRDTPQESISVFLMRRHAGMQFVAGTTVFPGCLLYTSPSPRD